MVKLRKYIINKIIEIKNYNRNKIQDIKGFFYKDKCVLLSSILLPFLNSIKELFGLINHKIRKSGWKNRCQFLKQAHFLFTQFDNTKFEAFLRKFIV